MTANYSTFVSHLKCLMALFTTIIGVSCAETKLFSIKFHCRVPIQRTQFHAKMPGEFNDLTLTKLILQTHADYI